MPKKPTGVSVDANATPVASADGKESPNTRRNRVNVNSPKGNKVMRFDNNNGPPAGIMTQVSREDQEITTQQRQVTEDDRRCCGWLCCYNNKASSSKQSATSTSSGTAGGSAIGMTSTKQPAPEINTAAEIGDAGAEPSDPEVSESEDPEGLLGPRDPQDMGKKCLVLDLDETLVHSSFKPVPDADFIVPVEIDQVIYKVYVLKRPHVDKFLTEVAKHYEVVIFTASLSLYANPLLDMLDTNKVIRHRLFRESCVLHGQAYVKDMSKLGRKMKDIMIVDNSPLSYAFQPTSAIPITSWFDDRADNQLDELLPVLETTLKDCKDVRDILDANNKSFKWLCAQSR